MDYVRYIDKTRDYYLSQGYDKPYAWAHNETAPFTPLKKPLAEARIGLLSTSELAVHYDPKTEENPISEEGFRSVYAIPADTPTEKLYSRTHSYDSHATTLDDVNSFFPVDRMREAVASGRIAGFPDRFYGCYNNYSQRKVLEEEAPKALQFCREDKVDAVVMVPVWPVCHQTVSLIARYLEEHGVPTVMIATARDIVEHCAVPRLLFVDFPLGNPCGEPYNLDQQREIFEKALHLLETAKGPQTTVEAGYRWSQGERWKELIFTEEQPFLSGNAESEWLERKEAYRRLKAEGKL